MERKEFETLVDEGFLRLPEWVREKIKNVALLVEDEPSEEDRREQGLKKDETLLGLYKGIPLSARGDGYGVGGALPDTITLYQKPIEEAASDATKKLVSYELTNMQNSEFVTHYMEKVREIVADTIWHEFAHHFGIDEDGVERRERERGIGDYRA